MGVSVAVSAAQHARDWVDYATLCATVIGVFVVGLYTYYTKRQREATETANELATKALEMSRESPEE